MFPVRSALILLLLATPAPALTLTGAARVVDGDTLDVAGDRVRLFGIDAPEMDQTCMRTTQDWACGVWARNTLNARIAGQTVTCDGAERDRYGRLIAVCHAGRTDLGRALVHDGAARAYRRYSDRYVVDESVARTARVGLWAGPSVAPEEFRLGGRQEGAAATGGCAIKGNISAGGRIFHLPGSAAHAATRIDPQAGERWFCSEAEARAAGWRAPGR